MDKSTTAVRDRLDAGHGPLDRMGWAVRLRHRFGYVTPDEYYMAVVEKLINSETVWIDVGGGSSMFPSNPKLARILADRCKRLVAVDPSSDVNHNSFAHECYQSVLEDFQDPTQFTLATTRMVVEHVTNPPAFVGKLSQLIGRNGKVVVYTVDRWAPMTILSGCTPTPLHHFFKKWLWDTEEKDTFPVTYLMNTRGRLNALFTQAGFREIDFRRLDDCRTLAKWKITFASELTVWKALRFLGLRYPESCLLGIYERV